MSAEPAIPRRTPLRAALGAYVGAVLALGFVLAHADPTDARPERIRPGIAYYSAEFVARGGVSDLGEERNYEEVYRHYAYYEAVYDQQGRVVTFTVYERGAWTRRERYRYDDDARRVTRETEYAHGRHEVLTLPLP